MSDGHAKIRKGPEPLSSDDIRNRFSFHPATSQGRQMEHKNIRDRCLSLGLSLAGNLPHNGELALAITKLEEVMFWANASVARTQDTASPDSEIQHLSEKAQRAYEAYSRVTGGKTHDGRDMPSWEFLGDKIQAAWIASVQV